MEIKLCLEKIKSSIPVSMNYLPNSKGHFYFHVYATENGHYNVAKVQFEVNGKEDKLKIQRSLFDNCESFKKQVEDIVTISKKIANEQFPELKIEEIEKLR